MSLGESERTEIADINYRQLSPVFLTRGPDKYWDSKS
jgi:hypothetical protein